LRLSPLFALTMRIVWDLVALVPTLFSVICLFQLLAYSGLISLLINSFNIPVLKMVPEATMTAECIVLALTRLPSGKGSIGFLFPKTGGLCLLYEHDLRHT
jgi:spore maturation protein SpmB